MADADSGQPVAGSQEPVAIQDSSATDALPSPVVEQTAMPEVATAPTEPEAAQSETAQTHGNEPIGLESAPVDGPLVLSEETPPHGKESPESEETPSEAKESPRARSIKGNIRKQEKRRMKIERLMSEIEKRGRVTNDEVEKLLHVSDATATRYLSALEKDGKIKQVGKTGIGVVYIKI